MKPTQILNALRHDAAATPFHFLQRLRSARRPRIALPTLPRRRVLGHDKAYLRALREAEQAAWERAFPATGSEALSA